MQAQVEHVEPMPDAVPAGPTLQVVPDLNEPEASEALDDLLDVQMVNGIITDPKAFGLAIERVYNHTEGEATSIAQERINAFEFLFQHATQETIKTALKPETWGIGEVRSRTPAQKTLASRLSEVKRLYRVRMVAPPSDWQRILNPELGAWKFRVGYAAKVLRELSNKATETDQRAQYIAYHESLGADPEVARERADDDLRRWKDRQTSLAALPPSPEEQAEKFIRRAFKDEKRGAEWAARYADGIIAAYDKVLQEYKDTSKAVA